MAAFLFSSNETHINFGGGVICSVCECVRNYMPLPFQDVPRAALRVAVASVSGKQRRGQKRKQKLFFALSLSDSVNKNPQIEMGAVFLCRNLFGILSGFDFAKNFSYGFQAICSYMACQRNRQCGSRHKPTEPDRKTQPSHVHISLQSVSRRKVIRSDVTNIYIYTNSE